MTQTEYEQQRRKCWEDYCQKYGHTYGRIAFDFAFDRAFTLGREKETISQEEIEKASVEYADKTAKQYEVCNSEFVQEIMVAFEQGVNYALGKQTKTITQEEIKNAAKEVVRKEYLCEKCAWKDDCDFCGGGNTAFDCCECPADSFEDGFKAGANFTLGKQEKDAEYAVIQGWVARDKEGYLVLHYKEPHRTLGNTKWYSAQSQKSLPRDSFPDLTWESEPQEVEIIIKRKKNG